MGATSLPRVRIISLGGTIASVADGGYHVAPRLRGATIAGSVPGLATLATLEFVDHEPVPSTDVTPSVALSAAHEIRDGLEAGCAGVVVTQGSDTLEETAYLLALVLERDAPVVLTAAMRNATLPSPDGPANLLAAVAVAGQPAAGRLGPVAVLGDEIHLARWLTKQHTSRPSALGSPWTGAVGDVVEGRVRLWHAPLWHDHLGLPDSLEDIDVAMLRLYPGIAPKLFEAVVASRPQGIVLEGTGGGHVPTALLETLDEAITAGIPVVVATRCAGGRNLEATYDFPGAEVDLRRRGALPAGWLSGTKARLRLMVALALGREPTEAFPVD